MQKTLTFRVLATLYLLSGALGLVYEVAFNKYLAYAFGATAYASSAVLVAFMGGIAAGAFLAGRAERVVERPLLVYGTIEVALGSFCLLTPNLFEIVQLAYIDFARQQHSLVTLTVGRALIATTIVLMPALGMGATLPLLARFVHGMRHSWSKEDGVAPEAKVAALYGINTLGGALGSLISAYLILPSLGLSTTLRASALISISIGIFSIVSGWSLVIPPPRQPAAGEGEGNERVEGELGSLDLALLGALSGFLVFSCEVVFVHLLAVVIGTSVYAFGLMLFIFLVCLSVGTPLAHRLHKRLGAHLLPSSLVATGLALVLSLLIWDHLPTLFIALGPTVRSWPGRELTRGLAAFVSLAVPVTLMGMTFPLLLRGVRREHATREVGRITTYNTVGSILGSILTGFFMLAKLGSYRSLVAIGLAYVAAGALVAWRLSLRERRIHLAFGGACLVVIALLPGWDLARLTSGANVYFDKGVVDKGVVESIREDVHGGVTTIVRDPTSGERTLMTNGKFEGNDNREIHPNRGFAHLPSSFAAKRERALVVGLGTGTTLGTMTAYPYKRIDVAELAPAIVDAAKTIFAGVNRRALEDPRVHILHEDGRNVLLTATEPYDVVTIEVTSIWFAGAANLYNRDFYEMVADRLAYGGVLQQWLQFHHTDRRTVATVLATIREVFPHVILVVNGHQGHMLASNQPLAVTRDGLAALEKEGQVGQTLDGHPLVHYVKGVVLDEPAVDRFIAETARDMQISPSALISTDDNLRLEYRTPKGNVPTADDIETTLRYLYSYRQPKAVLSVLQPLDLLLRLLLPSPRASPATDRPELSMTTETSSLPSPALAAAAAHAFSIAFERAPTAARNRTLWQLCADLLAHHTPGGQTAAFEHERERLADSFSPDELAEAEALLAGTGRLPEETSDEEIPGERLAARAQLARRLVTALGYQVRERTPPRMIRVGLAALGLIVALGALAVGLALRAPKNLAMGHPVHGSSTYSDTSPAGLVDGDKSKYGFHTELENDPWGEIDLGSVTRVSSVAVWNRSDSPGAVADRALPLFIEVSTDGKQFQQVARRERPFTTWKVSFPSVQARYVRVHVPRKTYLHLNEVEVYP